MTGNSTYGSCGDGFFGPGLGNSICRGGFDFTLLFEDSVLNVLPAACFLLLAPLRIWSLARRRDQVRRSPVYLWKLLAASILAVTATATVAVGFAAANRDSLSQVALPAAVLDLVASLALIALVYLEHFKSIRPSLLAGVFLSATVLLDVARLRSAWLQLPGTGWTASLTASLVAKLLLLGLESLEKRSLLLASEKPLSKESTGGPFNRALFLWLNGLLKTGCKATLSPETLPAVDERFDVDLLYKRIQASWLSVDRKKKFALLLALFKAFKLEMLAVVIPRLGLVGLAIAQPFMIGRTVTFLQGTSAESNNTGYGLIGAFALVFTLTAVVTALYQHLGYRVMTMIRGGLIATLYNHMMSLPAESVNESGALSLMGADAESFVEFFYTTIADLWADILQLAISIYLLARMIGLVVLAPVIVAVLFTSLSFKVGDMISGRQRTWLQTTQRRVNLTTEVLSRIRDVKILGLSDYLFKTVTGLRHEEMEKSKAYRRVSSFKVCLVNSPRFLAQFAVFAAYGIAASVRGTGQLSTSDTVTTLSLVNLLIDPLQTMIFAIPETYSAMSCLRRLQEFLAQDPRKEHRTLGQSSETMSLVSKDTRPLRQKRTPFDIELAPLNAGSDTRTRSFLEAPAPAISIQAATFGWKTPSRRNSSESAEDTAFSFESPGQGSLTVITGPVGCGKSTLLQAMLGETTFLCGRLRLSTPEVAYCSQDTWLVSGTMRQNIIGTSDGIVDSDWCDTVTTACGLDIDFANLPNGDNTAVGSKGIKLSGGQRQRIALARALYSKKRIILLDDIVSGLDNTTRLTVFHRVFGPSGLIRQTGCTVVMTAPQTSGPYLSMADYIIVLGPTGQVVEQGTPDALKRSGSPIVNLDPNDNGTASVGDTMGKGPEEGSPANAVDESQLDLLQSPDLNVWKYYFSAMGWTNLGLFSFFCTIESVFAALPYIWLTRWSASADATSNIGYWIGVYAVFGVLSTAGLALAVYWNWVVIVPTASKKLHSVVLTATMGATVSFLSSTDTGVLVNRFSQDMRLVDLVLPIGFVNAGFQLFGTVAQAGVAISALPYITPVIPVVIGVLVLIQRFYLRTSRQLRLLDIEMKAPVFSHFIESLHGLVTIRAFGWKPQYLEKSLFLLGNAQRPYYLLLSVQRWLTLVLNLVVAGVAILLVGLGVALRDRVQPGLLGVALVMVTSLGQVVTDLIQAWTSVETSLGAISRIKSFAETTPQEETGLEPSDVGENWPGSGAIEFRSVVARHDSAGDPVLKNINLTILPGQTVGICGRSGSGKSSLMMTLLRMVQVESGRITIDGQDIATLSPSLLRTRLNTMTQEPFIFGATVRENADPLATRSDDDIYAALRAVGILSVIASKAEAGPPGHSVLDLKMDDNMLSHGQRQLFAVARALLKKSSVLLLDEPTSRLDATSHDQVQSAVRSHFQGCTIVMVAHRLDSLLDFDRVVVLDGGRVVEFDSPTTLLADENSAFAKLYRGGGQR